jgi:hypothetical protein
MRRDWQGRAGDDAERNDAQQCAQHAPWIVRRELVDHQLHEEAGDQAQANAASMPAIPMAEPQTRGSLKGGLWAGLQCARDLHGGPRRLVHDLIQCAETLLLRMAAKPRNTLLADDGRR